MAKDQIIFFDGVCHLCNGFVNWVIRNDPSGQFKFASLQSDCCRDVIDGFGGNFEEMDSILLYDGDRLLSHSSAFFEIIRSLGFPLNLISFFTILPRSFTDKIYMLVANHRYKWFGESDHCMIGSNESKNRFLY